MAGSTEIEHDFQIGDRVKQHKGSEFYHQSYEVEGTIIAVDNRSRGMFHEYGLTIRWDNGHENSYHAHCVYKV